MRKIFFTMLAVCTLLAGCSEDETSIFGGIYGTIRDTETGMPIYNAEIILSPGSRTTVSGSDGSYEYQNLDAGQYSLSVVAKGYQYNSRTVSVLAGESTRCDMRLVPEKQMSGVEFSTTSLNFDKTYTDLTFEIHNVGTSGSVNWSITDISAAWLSVSPMSGTTDMGKSSSVKVSINRSLITEDAMSVFTVNAAGGSKSIVVSVYANNGGGNAGGNVGGQNPTNGLFAYYTFENNANNTVEGASHGQVINNPTYVNGVRNSKAMKFSASDNSSMFIPTSQGMFESSAFSISLWVRNISDGHIFHTSRTPGGNDSRGYNATGLYMQGGQLRFILLGYSTYYQFSSNMYYFTHGTIDDDWHMITLVTTVGTPNYSQALTKLYIDGDFIDSVSEFAGNLNNYSYNNTKQFIIGGKLDYDNYLQVNAVTMSIDNLRIYNTRALSDAEVRQIFNYEK